MSETNQLTEMLRPHVTALLADAASGNKAAKDTVTWYEMHRRSPGDPGAVVVCQEAFKDWQSARAAILSALEQREGT